MASNLAFDIFARDVNASRTFDEVGDNAERLERRLRGVGDGSSSLQARFKLLGDGASGLTARLDGIGGGAAAVGVSLISTAGKLGVTAAAMSSAASSAASLVSALAPAAGAIAALPGAVAAFAAANVVLKLSLYAVGDAMKAAYEGDAKKFESALEKLTPTARAFAEEFQATVPAMKEFQQAAQTGFFSELNGSLAHFVDLLRGTQPQIQALAGTMGGLTRELLVFGTAPETVGRFNSILSDTGGILSGLGGGMQPLLNGLLDLATVGATFLRNLSGGVGDVIGKFGSWLTTISESGQAMQWMNNAVVVFRQLGSIAADVGGILKGVFKAMQSAAGGGALGAIGQLLDGLNAFANSAAGQAALGQIFTTIGQIGKSLQPVVAALVSGLGELAPVIGELAQQIGPILTSAISGLVPALKALGPGVIVVFQALGQAVGELASSGALTEIARALADILIALAPLLPALAQVLVPLLQGLALLVNTVLVPALQTVVGWITGLVQKLSGASLSEDSWLVRLALTIRDAVMPIWDQLRQLVSKVVTDIAAWISANQGTFDEWGERIISIVKTVGQIVSGVFEFISIAWDRFGGPLLNLISGVFGGILQVIQGALTFIQGLIEVVLGVITGDWSRAWEGLKTAFSGVWEAIKGILGAAWEIIKFQITAGLNAIGAKWEDTWAQVKSIAQTAWNIIAAWIAEKVADVKTAIGRLAEIPGQVAGWFGRVKDSIADKLGDAVDFVRSIPGRIVDAMGNLGGLLYNAGRSIIQGLIDGLYSMLQNAYNAAADILNQIRNLFPFSPAKEGPFSGKGWTLYSGMSLAEGFAQGMARGRGLVGDAAAGLASAASFGVTAPVAPVVPAGVAPGGVLAGGAPTVININFAGSALASRDEIYRLLISALNEAKGRGFNLGVVGAS